MRHHACRIRRQRGIALLTALLITTLAVSAVASLFWHQLVEVRMMESQRLRLQTQWVQRAGLDWSRQLLRDDGQRSPELTTLDGMWNQQPAEISLDRYFDRDPAAQAGSRATLASSLVDAQSRYNLANLASDRNLNLAEIAVYERLLAGLRLDPALALRTALAIAGGQQGPGQGGGGVQRQASLLRVDELSSVPGYTPSVLAALSPFIVLLPAPADLNLDSAAPELLAAVARLPLPQARQLAERRRQAYFRSMAELQAALLGGALPDGVRVGLRSDYFLVENQIRLDHAELNTVSLLYRPRGSAASIELVWTRED
ncbi:type II secretion system minor pseudopilin GspK [Janthinobacterium sp. LB3P112]|uniref:type II secretion system minor pseudopilin GspK n=1 Tax=Janthinobacterium sp. LB3P112 TaxID=3424196 RepID=UPI003F284700